MYVWISSEIIELHMNAPLSLEHFFLVVGQNNFGDKITFFSVSDCKKSFSVFLSLFKSKQWPQNVMPQINNL